MSDRQDWQTTVPDNADRRIRALLTYWNQLRGDTPYPERNTIDPLDIPSLLANVMLIDVRPAEPHFVYRLMGTGVVAILGNEFTGQPVGIGVKPKEREAVLARYRFVATHAQCVYHAARLQQQDDDFTDVERLLLPVGPPGGPVNMILGLVVDVGRR